MTHFKKRPITLYFDEFVVVDKPLQNVLVSPPLVYNPKVESRGKKVVFTFNEKEKLRDSATYTINFGEAIRDLNENNVAENIRYVFSTGDVIDSLVLRGAILDAITGEPVDKATALLFDNLNDSAVINDRPYYFGRTDEKGLFKIENIKPGKFQLVGLKEENNNYKYDDPEEYIGYVDSIIRMKDEMDPQIVTIFKERPKPFIEDIDSTTRGLIIIKYNTALIDPVFRLENEDIKYQLDVVENNIRLWHTAPKRTRWWFYIERGEKTDSLRIVSYQLDSTMAKTPLTCSKPKRHIASQHQDSLVYINFSAPIVDVQTERFLITNTSDSTFSTELRLREGYRAVEDEFTFEPVKTTGDLILNISEGDIFDIYGRTVDSLLECPFKILDDEGFSNLSLTIKGFEEDKSYFLQLKDEELVRNEWVVKGMTEWEGQFDKIIPKDYALYILEDLNENKMWDAGRFLERRQPERKREETISDLRANWDVEQEIDISNWYEDVIIEFPIEEEEEDEEELLDEDDPEEEEEDDDDDGGK